MSVCCVAPARPKPGLSRQIGSQPAARQAPGTAGRLPGRAALSQARPGQAQERNRNGQVAVTGKSLD